MIVKMKKLSLFCAKKDRQQALEILRELGVVHVTHERIPEGEDLERARARLTYVRRAMDVLPRRKNVAPSGLSGDEIIEAVWGLIQEREEIEDKLEDLRHEELRLRPYGSFDPRAVRDLSAKGITIRLYRFGPRRGELQVPEGTVLIEISRDEQGVYCVAVSRGELELDAREIPLPPQSLDGLRSEIAALKRKLVACEERMQRHAGDHGVVARILHDAEEKVRFLEAREGMGISDPVAYLSGYIPAGSEDKIVDAAARNGWGYRIDAPSPQEQPPTCVRNPGWVRPIKAIFEIIGVVPGYREVDISTVFLLFLSVFFAILVGDAGYGLLFIGASLWGKFKFRHLPQHIFNLLLIMGTTTLLWGVMTGVYFGITPAALPAPLQQLRVGWLTDENNAESNIMRLCFLIGAIHLTIAHAWNAVQRINSTRALAQLGWICTTWTMYYAALHMVLGEAFPSVMWGVLIAGAALIVLFMTPFKELKREWFGFVVLPLDLVSNFVDIVSYIRLFAVGSASFAVANAFNEMGMNMGWGSLLSGLGAAMIIFFGQTLNILLCGMGVLVHGVRLNTLEFSGHLGMQWTGYRYEPFRKREAG